MESIKIEIPADISVSLKFPPEERPRELRRELALALYERGALSLGKARLLAEMERWEFHELLGERDVPRHYTKENIDEDLQYVQNNC